MTKNKRTVIEVSDQIHGEIRRLAVLNDIRIHKLANMLLEEILNDEEKVKAIIKKLRLSNM